MATEKRLIYLDEAIAKIVDTPSVVAERVFNGDYGYEQNPDVSVDRQHEIIDLLETVPTVDAVEVVRCKDCRFRKSTFNGDGYFCSVWDTDDYEEAYVKDNDFCSYGERKDND